MSKNNFSKKKKQLNGTIHKNENDKKYIHEFYESFEDPPYVTAVATYLIYIVLNLVGRIRDFLHKWNIGTDKSFSPSTRMKHFGPLYQDYEAFYTRHVYRRIRDCWNRPVSSAPAGTVDLVNRVSVDYNWTFRNLGTSTKVINFGSYNYLGFAEKQGECAERVEESINKYGVGVGSCRQEVGTMEVHKHLEKKVAEFTGQEEAIIFPMGFATNALNIPILVDKRCCVISDELNHTSLILGIRLSGAHIKRFKHNNMASLEKQVREAIIYGQARTKRPFKKIMVVVEGIYSMEGSIVRLPEIVELKRRYGFLLYVDEAHSIGALGSTGRGVVDYFGLEPGLVDVAMGTFTKSFAGAGGYLAGSSRLIRYVRQHSHAAVYGYAGGMPGPVCQQIYTSMHLLMTSDIGARKIRQLAWNTRYFRASLAKKGFILFGNKDSPVVPIIICKPTGLAAFSRECLKRGVGTVVVGFPATSIILARARFCMSSSHNKEMIDKAIDVIDEVGYMINMKYSRQPPPDWCYEEILPAIGLHPMTGNGNCSSNHQRKLANGDNCVSAYGQNEE